MEEESKAKSSSIAEIKKKLKEQVKKCDELTEKLMIEEYKTVQSTHKVIKVHISG